MCVLTRQHLVIVLPQVCDAYGLGLGEPLPLSAAHNEGMTDLMEKLMEVSERCVCVCVCVCEGGCF
jgi:hypothetical protein